MWCAVKQAVGHFPGSTGQFSGSVAVRATRRWWCLTVLVAGCATATPGLALMLDAIAEQSLLGQPFRVVVPVVAQPGEELSGECIKVIPSRVDAGDSVPAIAWARIAMERVAASTRLVITTGLAVNDPAMRMTLEVGCDRAIRREYTMLFDPPLEDAPVADAGAAMSASANTAPASPPAAAAAPRAAAAAAATPVPAPAFARSASPAARTGHAADRTVARSAEPRPASSTATARPRLAISRSENGFAAMSKSEQLAALQEQEVVLRSRVAELSLLVERMQQERIAALSAQVERLQLEANTAAAAQRAAEEAARMSPMATLARWYDENWPIVLVLLAASLVGGALLWWRRSAPSRTIPDDDSSPLTGDPQSGLVDTYVDDMLIASALNASRFANARSPNTQTGNFDTKPPSPRDHEDDFDHDVATQPQPATQSRR